MPLTLTFANLLETYLDNEGSHRHQRGLRSEPVPRRLVSTGVRFHPTDPKGSYAASTLALHSLLYSIYIVYYYSS
jgi:hypothetical protein